MEREEKILSFHFSYISHLLLNLYNRVWCRIISPQLFDQFCSNCLEYFFFTKKVKILLKLSYVFREPNEFSVPFQELYSKLLQKHFSLALVKAFYLICEISPVQKTSASAMSEKKNSSAWSEGKSLNFFVRWKCTFPSLEFPWGRKGQRDRRLIGYLESSVEFNAKINQDNIAVAELPRLSEANKIVVFLTAWFFLLPPHLSLSVCKVKKPKHKWCGFRKDILS